MGDFYTLSPEQQGEHFALLARAALPFWNLRDDADVDLIKIRENAVFSVTDGDRRYAMRIHRADYHTDAELESELEWIAAINSPELRTPQVIPDRDGRRFIRVAVDAVPEERQVDLLEWVDGEPIGTSEEGVSDTSQAAETFRTVGQLMARAHDHGEHWKRPEGFTRHAWDGAGLLGEEPFWGRFWELPGLSVEQRARLHEVRHKARAELADFGQGPDRYGLIHADFLPENLLRSAAGIWLIDFDDAGFGWHLFDVATTLFFHMDEDYFEEATASLLAGYRSIRSMPDEHWERLPLFYLLRGTTYLGWAHTRSETETAKELTPMLIVGVDEMAKAYL